MTNAHIGFCLHFIKKTSVQDFFMQYVPDQSPRHFLSAQAKTWFKFIQ